MDENTNLQDIQQDNESLYFDVNIPEQIFQAIDIIVKKRLEQLPYDQTIEGQIISNERAFFGEYVVKIKSGLTFKAYSDNPSYKLYEKVYINIPQGDYSKQKVISGRIIPENTEYLLGTPTTYEELFGGQCTGADWNIISTKNKINIDTNEAKKKDLLNQFLNLSKQYTETAIEMKKIINQNYLDSLEQYFHDSGGLIQDEITEKIMFKSTEYNIDTLYEQQKVNRNHVNEITDLINTTNNQYNASLKSLEQQVLTGKMTPEEAARAQETLDANHKRQLTLLMAQLNEAIEHSAAQPLMTGVALQHMQELQQLLTTYQEAIQVAAEVMRSFITPNREIKE